MNQIGGYMNKKTQKRIAKEWLFIISSILTGLIVAFVQGNVIYFDLYQDTFSDLWLRYVIVCTGIVESVRSIRWAIKVLRDKKEVE